MNDLQLRCILRTTQPDGSPIDLRVVVTVATEAVAEAARRHGTNPVASVVLGRTLLAGSLLATLTKTRDDESSEPLQERLTLQLTGDGPLGSVVVDASGHGDVRGYPRRSTPTLAEAVSGKLAGANLPEGVRVVAVGDGAGPTGPGGLDRPRCGWALGRTGYVNVVRDLGLKDLYRGQVPLIDGEVDTEVQSYLCTSEQVASTCALEVRLGTDGQVQGAAGVLVQSLPRVDIDIDGEGNPVELRGPMAEIDRRLKGGLLWRALGEQIEALAVSEGALTIDPRGLALAVAGDLGVVSVLEERPVRFRCRCTRERVISALTTLGPTELLAMHAEQGHADVSCHFCNQSYTVAGDELLALARPS